MYLVARNYIIIEQYANNISFTITKNINKAEYN